MLTNRDVRRPDGPEKSTNQLAVWNDLIEALDRLNSAWERTQSTGTHIAASTQLPGNVVVALSQATGRGTQAIAGITGALVNQHDTGDAFRLVADTLRQAHQAWPTR